VLAEVLERGEFPLSGLASFTLIALIEAPDCGSCRYAVTALRHGVRFRAVHSMQLALPPSLPGEVPFRQAQGPEHAEGLAVVQEKGEPQGRCRVVHSLGIGTIHPTASIPGTSAKDPWVSL
jgi:hypothetical protein